MMGIVFMGLYQINLVLLFNKILFKAVFNRDFNWNWINLTSLSPILLMIFVSTIFILIYLYKTSKLMNKQRFISILIIVIFIFALVTVFTLQENRPSKVKFRLTFITSPMDSTASSLNWIGELLSTLIAQQLQLSVADQAIISPIEWTKNIVRIDSITNLAYLRKLDDQIKAEYIFVGKPSGSNMAPKFSYQIMKSQNGETVIGRSVPIAPNKLAEISSEICHEILDYFQLDSKIEIGRIRYISFDAYQKYLAGQDFYQHKKYHLAIDAAQQAILADSAIVEAYLLIGKSYFMIGSDQKNKGDSPVEKFEKAKEWLTQTVAIDTCIDEAYSFLGEYYIYQDRWSLAEQMLIKAYHLNPNNPRVYIALSRLHPSRYQKLRFKNEEQLFKQAIFVNPCYEDGYLMLADYYLFENKRKRAIQVLEQMLQINPDSVPVLLALGKIYLLRNEILKIIEIYNRVLELEPSNSDAYYNLGILYYNSKDFDNAEQFLKRAIAIDNHLNAHLYLAYLYEIKGEYGKAIEQLRTRIRYRKGLDDEFAEEARKHLFKLLHGDSSRVDAAQK